MTRFDGQFSDSPLASLMDVHGEAITYTPTGGGPASITAIVDRQGVTIEDDEHGRALVRVMAVHVATADVASPHPDDECKIDSLTWAVRDVLEVTGGMATVSLVRPIRQEDSRQGFRKGVPG
jgi:hypothetical protein